MKAPVITVKKVQTFRGHDGIGVNADVYIDKIFVGYAHDDANGGELDFQFVFGENPAIRERAKKKFDELTKYAASLDEIDLDPERKWSKNPMMVKVSADDLINDVINKHIEEKENAKKEKEKMRAIMYGVPNSECYKIIHWTGKTMMQVCSTTQGKMIAQATIKDLKKKLKNGEVILNASYLETLGLVI